LNTVTRNCSPSTPFQRKQYLRSTNSYHHSIIYFTTMNDQQPSNDTSRGDDIVQKAKGNDDSSGVTKEGSGISNNKKRNNKWKFNNHKNKKSRKDKQKNWKGNPWKDDEKDGGSNEHGGVKNRGKGKDTPPHEGSYANLALLKLFKPEDVPAEEARIAEAEKVKKEEEEKEKKKEIESEEARKTEETPEVITDASVEATAEADAPAEVKAEASEVKAETSTEATAESAPTDVVEAAAVDAAAVAARHPKKKVALMIAFLGTNYTGMQINPQQKTIHAELEYAMFKCQYISRDNYGYPNKYSWSNSARTDKGVHSAAQVCSCKINVPPNETMDDVRTNLNAYLPDDIAILDIVKTTRSFSAKTFRDKVRYTYMIPSYIFHPDLPQLLQTLSPPDLVYKSDSQTENVLKNTQQISELQKQLKSYRASPAQLALLQSALHEFVGTHAFHNYTSKKAVPGGYSDMSAKRYILKFDIADPIISANGTEWIVTRVTGQSFLLNQIRKMVSMAMDVARGAGCGDKGGKKDETPEAGAGKMEEEKTADTENGSKSDACGTNNDSNGNYDDGCATLQTMKDSFANRFMKINIAPAQGLFLDMSYFDGYNRKNEKLSGDNHNALLEWAHQETDDDDNNDHVGSKDDDAMEEEKVTIDDTKTDIVITSTNNEHTGDDDEKPTTAPENKEKPLKPSSPYSVAKQQAKKEMNEASRKRWKAFRNEKIAQHIMKEEETEFHFLKYMHHHEAHFDPKVNYASMENKLFVLDS